jgi:hypothetical protein
MLWMVQTGSGSFSTLLGFLRVVALSLIAEICPVMPGQVDVG